MKDTPWPFQERVSAHLLRGNNVVLQAPTGAGKTRAALEPFLANLARGYDGASGIPHTCRYAVPLRVLASQFYKEYGRLNDRLKDSPQLDGVWRTYRDYRMPIPFVAEQTGENSGDRQLEAGLTFCTIDQLLAAFLGLPYGVSPRATNLKVAGVLGSYLVLDEWHLYPLRALTGRPGQTTVQGARSTTLAMLRLLNQQELGRFTLMTATFSSHLVAGLASLLGAKVESLREGARDDETAGDAFRREYEEIATGRMRTISRSRMSLEESVGDIIDQHQGSTLVVCNQVERAQALYLRIKEECDHRGSGTPKVLLLHSRFIPEDRAALSRSLEAEIGAEAWDGRANGTHPEPNLIVVATQVVEVGLNISATRLHTELAPANSLVQRAGRCARFPRQQGHVVVHPLAERPNSPQWALALPYAADLCHATLEALPEQADKFDFAREQELIDRVHTAQDEEFLNAFEQNETQYKTMMFQGWRWDTRHSDHAAAELIRDVEQVPVLIHDDPDKAITQEPWQWHAFGLPPGTLIGRWDRLQDLSAELDLLWTVKKVEFSVGPTTGTEEDSRAPLACTWTSIAAKEDIAGAIMVVLPSALAHYDKNIGFVLRDLVRLPGLRALDADRWQSTQRPWKRLTTGGAPVIEIQTYGAHISGLINAYEWVLANELRWPATRLEHALGLEVGTIDRVIRLVIACHDLGKLTVGWQRWVRAWQALLAQREGQAQGVERPAVPPGVLLAKSDFDFSRRSGHRELQRELSRTVRRPPHAVEGVALGQHLLRAGIDRVAPGDKDNEDMLLRAVYTAIAHHHTTDAVNYGETELAAAASGAIEHALRCAKVGEVPDTRRIATASKGGNMAIKFTEVEVGIPDQIGVWLYFLIVRALRLSDQRADIFRDRNLDRFA